MSQTMLFAQQWVEYILKIREFPPHNTSKIEKGDILICNETYGHYKGEMQIALQNMENSGVKNVIGKINEDEHFY